MTLVNASDRETYANLLLNHSLRVQSGDLLRIRGEQSGLPLMETVYREAVKRGAQPFLELTLPELDEVRLREAPESALDFVSPIAQGKIDAINADLWVIAEPEPLFCGVDPDRLRRWQRAQGSLLERWAARTGVSNNRLRWCAALYPTASLAQAAQQTEGEFLAAVRHALLLDAPDPEAAWKALSERQQDLCKRLVECERFRIVAGETDLTFRTGGRGWINGNGRLNLPDGEVCTAPIEDSAAGTLAVSYPLLYQGQEIQGATLTFYGGRVVECNARAGKSALESLLRTDDGAGRLGEFAIATNEAVTDFSRCILLDEKMGGTCHLALGRSIPGTGGVNASAVHLDMVVDLRQGGQIFAEGKRIYENGQFTAAFLSPGERRSFWQRWNPSR